jgi:hypothetical protein
VNQISSVLGIKFSILRYATEGKMIWGLLRWHDVEQGDADMGAARRVEQG